MTFQIAGPGSPVKGWGGSVTFEFDETVESLRKKLEQQDTISPYDERLWCRFCGANRAYAAMFCVDCVDAHINKSFRAK